MNTLASYYISNDFTVVGWLPVPPYVQYKCSRRSFDILLRLPTFDKNTDNVLQDGALVQMIFETGNGY